MKLTELEAAAAVTSADLIYVVQGGVSKRGTISQLGSAVEGSTTVRKAADQTVINNNTPALDNELFLPVEAGAIYRITAIINSTNVGSCGLSVALAGGGGATASEVSVQGMVISTSNAPKADYLNALDMAVDQSGVSLLGSEIFASMSGTVIMATAGTLGVAWSCRGAFSGTDTTTVLKGSYLELVRIA